MKIKFGSSTHSRINLFAIWIFLVSVLYFFPDTKLCAQATQFITHPDKILFDARHAYQQNNFATARHLFDQYLLQNNYNNVNDNTIHANPVFVTEAKFYQAVCAYMVNASDAEMLLAKFIDETSSGQYEAQAYFYLGKYYFANGNFKEALACFSKSDTRNLTEEEADELNFKLGYSNFTNKQWNDAKTALAKIIDKKNSAYYHPANYYYGFISLQQQNYNSAIASFNRLDKHKTYSPYIPYYTALIYYYQNRYNELLEYAEPRINQPGVQHQTELNQLVGLVHFNKGNFEKALPFLEFYESKSKKLSGNDLYMVAFTQYKTQHYDRALKNFSELSNAKDSLKQNALYHLADCYLKTNQKQEARNAFFSASQLNANADIKETALFSYAKLSFELGFDNDAIKNLQDFIVAYPKSKNNVAAYSLLSQVFEFTQNYSKALEVLEQVGGNKIPELSESVQRVAYLRGVELFNERKFDQAIEHFNKSLAAAQEPSYTALAHFWTADAYYRQAKYNNAINHANRYLATAGGRAQSDKVNPASARYTLGYALFKQQKYADAFSHFEAVTDALANNSNTQPVIAPLYPDALLRSGDCQFMQRNYKSAANFYNAVINKSLPGTDYAYFQKSMIAGLTGFPEEKISGMKSLIKNYANSYYTDDAMYQIGLTQISINQGNQAISTLEELLKKYPQSDYAPKAIANIALTNFNLNNLDAALFNYERIMKQYPKSPQANDAVMGIRDVYAARGDAQGYINYMQQYPDFAISTNAQDTLSYEIAESYYNKGDCTSAIKEFTDYLHLFQQGAFALYAHFYRGQCLYSRELYDQARTDYDYVIAQKGNPFMEQALDKGGRIALYIDKNYAKAHGLFEQLLNQTTRKELVIEALRGLVRTSYFTQNATDIKQYTQQLITQPNATQDDKLDAVYYPALLDWEQKRYAEALPNLQKVANQSVGPEGAKARYCIADIYLKQGKLEEAKNACMRVAKETPSHEYWVAKSYLTLADVYLANKQIFQAKATVESIIEGYEPTDDGILQGPKKN